ncbi:isochorismatase, partial [Sinorhizobium meliloti]
MKKPLRIDRAKAAAIFIDLQEEHRRDERYLVEGYDTVLGNAARLQSAARRSGIPVF